MRGHAPSGLGRGDGGTIPRERVRKLTAGRRSVRRRRRARARWCEVRVPADEPEAVDLDPGVLRLPSRWTILRPSVFTE